MRQASSATAFFNGRVVLHCGDCLQVLPTLADNSIDAVVTDPPYHLGHNGKTSKSSKNGFMSKAWDGGDIAFQPDVWRAVLRVLKPGGYLLACGGTRTYHRMACAIEDGGFVIRDCIMWLYGMGWPKNKYALKPAVEPIVLARKPLAEATIEDNIRKWGTGTLNIDDCRIALAPYDKIQTIRHNIKTDNYFKYKKPITAMPYKNGKRYPANVIHDGSDEVIDLFPAIGLGSPARFFYSAKVDNDQRLGSRHPTIKPIELKQYLIRLITPAKGVVLDLFAGTGSTGEAAYREGVRAILIERELEYQNDIKRRMQLVLSEAGSDRRKVAIMQQRDAKHRRRQQVAGIWIDT
jgi:site-specific DNA-methyltransferase (adenine-specific)